MFSTPAALNCCQNSPMMRVNAKGLRCARSTQATSSCCSFLGNPLSKSPLFFSSSFAFSSASAPPPSITRYHHSLATKASATASSATQPSSPPPSGIFLRDTSRSDMKSYERALALLELGQLQRLTAVQLIEGIEVTYQGTAGVTLRFLTVVPFFNVAELYRFDTSVSISRRDLRSGEQVATAAVDTDGALRLKSKWTAPNAGSVEEVLSMIENGKSLEYVSTLRMENGGIEVTKQVYTKVDAWKPQFEWNPLKALQMMAAAGK